jgi:pre-mRNA-splicing factor ATP-dependent RNA helicase DHX15/PRP43
LENEAVLIVLFTDKDDKNWAWTNYISSRALQQAENVRGQLQRTMERFEIELITLDNPKKLFENIRKALVAGFFMQVAHKEGERGNYLTVKDNQVSELLINAMGNQLKLML